MLGASGVLEATFSGLEGGCSCPPPSSLVSSELIFQGPFSWLGGSASLGLPDRGRIRLREKGRWARRERGGGLDLARRQQGVGGRRMMDVGTVDTEYSVQISVQCLTIHARVNKGIEIESGEAKRVGGHMCRSGHEPVRALC